MAGRDIEVEDDRPFVLEGETRRYDFEAGGAEAVIRPVSRTFIRSRLADNPYLTASGYMATLQAMPEPLRSQMLEGDFAAGAADDSYSISTSPSAVAQHSSTLPAASSSADNALG